MTEFDDALLVLIDMQRAFQLPGAQWECAGYDAAAANIARLRAVHTGQAVWTQFIRDPVESGAWQAYYDRWDQYRVAPDHELWDLTLTPQPEDVVFHEPTFGKWTPQLTALTAGYDHLIMAGVATDCCVLATVLPAVDAGKHVTVVSDACAGATEQAHEQALALMGMLSPMVTLTTTAQLLNGR